MHLRSPLKFIFLVGGLTASANALAATAECQRYRAELVSRGRDSGGAAQQQRVEIARLSAYHQSIGCNGAQFSFFGSPPECGAIAQRIGMMQANHARLASDAGGGISDARRRQLMAAVQQACNPQREAAVRREAEERRSRTADEDASPRRLEGGRLGGGRLVCVRTCDGSFFPLQNLPEGGKSQGDEMCQALCPGAETAAYSMPRGQEADLAQAVSLKGKRYTKLAGAFKYQTSFDSSCSCRKPGQSWVEALQKAEKMIERSPGDIIVTATKAEELSRPGLARKEKSATPAQTRAIANAPGAKTLDVETTASVTSMKPAAAESQGAGVATSGPEYSASGAQAGERQSSEAVESGAKRSIRVVGPTFISLPETAAE